MAVKISEYRGVERLYIAKVTEVTEMVNGEEVIKEQYGTPMQLAGVQEISHELSESSETHYYDNKGAIVVDSEGDDTYTLTVSVTSLKTRSIIEGTYYDESLGALIGTPKYRDYFAIGFVGNKLNGEDEYNWILKGKFSGGGATHSTKDDGTDATNISYTFTSIYTSQEFEECPDYDGNAQAVKAITVEGDTRIDVSKWFDQVVTPENIGELELASIDESILTVAPQDEEDWYLGKSGADLMSSDTKVLADGKVVGTLYHINNFTEFSGDESLQEGYYFGFVLNQTGTTMSFLKNGEYVSENIAWEANNIFRVVSTGTTFGIEVDGDLVVTLDFSKINFD